jgi:hypothetical protein
MYASWAVTTISDVFCCRNLISQHVGNGKTYGMMIAPVNSLGCDLVLLIFGGMFPADGWLS